MCFVVGGALERQWACDFQLGDLNGQKGWCLKLFQQVTITLTQVWLLSIGTKGT